LQARRSVNDEKQGRKVQGMMRRVKWTCPVEVARRFCTLMPLVDYDSESDQDAPDMAVATVTQNAVTSSAKKRCAMPLVKHCGRRVPADGRKQPLPSLPKTYESGKFPAFLPSQPTHVPGVAPRDDPAFHQGRKRTRPYVDGDYDTHIYLSRELCVS
jgi:hypothetical protein